MWLVQGQPASFRGRLGIQTWVCQILVLGYNHYTTLALHCKSAQSTRGGTENCSIPCYLSICSLVFAVQERGKNNGEKQKQREVFKQWIALVPSIHNTNSSIWTNFRAIKTLNSSQPCTILIMDKREHLNNKLMLEPFCTSTVYTGIIFIKCCWLSYIKIFALHILSH